MGVTFMYANGFQEQFPFFPGSKWEDKLQRVRDGEKSQFRIADRGNDMVVYHETPQVKALSLYLPYAPPIPEARRFQEGARVRTKEGVQGTVWWQRDEMILLAVEGEKGYYPTLASEVIED